MRNAPPSAAAALLAVVAALSGCASLAELSSPDLAVHRTIPVTVRNEEAVTHSITLATTVGGEAVDQAAAIVSGNGTASLAIRVPKSGNVLFEASLETGRATEITLTPGSCKSIALTIRIAHGTPAFTDTMCG